jgi:hypothetical protein
MTSGAVNPFYSEFVYWPSLFCPRYLGRWLMGCTRDSLPSDVGLASGRHRWEIHRVKESEVRLWIHWLLSFGVRGLLWGVGVTAFVISLSALLWGIW